MTALTTGCCCNCSGEAEKQWGRWMPHQRHPHRGWGFGRTCPQPCFWGGKNLKWRRRRRRRERKPERGILLRAHHSHTHLLSMLWGCGAHAHNAGRGMGRAEGASIEKTNKQTQINPLQRSGPKGKMNLGCLCSPDLPLTSPGSFPGVEGLSLLPPQPQNVLPGSLHHHDYSPRRGKKSQSPQISHLLSSLPVLHPKIPVPQ